MTNWASIDSDLSSIRTKTARQNPDIFSYFPKNVLKQSFAVWYKSYENYVFSLDGCLNVNTICIYIVGIVLFVPTGNR